MDKVRYAAINALLRQEQGGYSNLVLQNVLEKNPRFSAREKAFLSAVFYGVVERQFTIDFLLQKCLNRPLRKLDAVVRAILRAGLYQIRWMDGVPIHAAVNESVSLTKGMRKTSAAGLVNAVLRRASEIDLEKETFSDPIQRLSVVYSVSPEIAALFLEKLPDRCEEILRASFSHPDLCIRVNSLKTSPEILRKYFQEKGISVREGRVPGCFYVDFHGDLAADEAFQRGMFHVQGEASQIACAALSPRPGEKVLDLCAAPGGKSVTLAQYMENRGQLCARDATENRLSLIEEAFRRCGVTCGQVRCADAAVFDEKLCDADAVLCDVPCSGLGILSKKPDIRCKDLKGLPELLRIQREILCTAAKYVKPGGRLVYSTCTLNPDENEKTVQAFLRENSEFYVKKVPYSKENSGMTTFYPYEQEADGFFVACLERTR